VYAPVVQRDVLHHPGNPETTPCGKKPVADNIAGDTSISPVPVTEATAAAERNPVDVADWLY